MSTVKQIVAREILDSRGNPTIETEVFLSDGILASSSVPSGASKGTYEAVELRDNDISRYAGLGVLNAVKNVNDLIAPKLLGMEITDQQKIDKIIIEIDGTQNKGRLGANATLSVSQACVKAAAKSLNIPVHQYIGKFIQPREIKKLPTPLFNVLEGGKHADNGVDFQEFLVIPASTKSFSEGLEIGSAIYRSLKKLLSERSVPTLSADEGGFAPQLPSTKESLGLIKQAIDQSGFMFSYDVFMGVDVAATSFFESKSYKLKEKPAPLGAADLTEYYKTLFNDYSLTYIEDPFAEEDWDGWKKMQLALGDKTLIVGDDLTTTNPFRLQLALDNNVIGGIIIKPNQIGTITEAIAVSEMAKFKNLKVAVSHRSGETLDDFIADFAVGINADYAKFGAPSRERIAKYNRLKKIETELASI